MSKAQDQLKQDMPNVKLQAEKMQAERPEAKQEKLDSFGRPLLASTETASNAMYDYADNQQIVEKQLADKEREAKDSVSIYRHEMRMTAYYSPRMGAYEFWLSAHPGHLDRTQQFVEARYVVMEKVDYQSSSSRPLFHLEEPACQQLMNDLWNAGIRPTGAKHIAEELKMKDAVIAAKDEHILSVRHTLDTVFKAFETMIKIMGQFQPGTLELIEEEDYKGFAEEDPEDDDTEAGFVEGSVPITSPPG